MQVPFFFSKLFFFILGRKWNIQNPKNLLLFFLKNVGLFTSYTILCVN